MFPYADAQATLEIQHQHAADLRREAAAYRLARAVSRAGRHRRSGRQPEGVRAPVMP